MYDILLWFAAYLVAALAAACAIDVLAILWAVISMTSFNDIGGRDGLTSGFIIAWFFWMWLAVVIITSPFVVVFSGLPEAFGVKPSILRYTVFGALAIIILLSILIRFFGTRGSNWPMWFTTIAGATGGYVMAYLRLGPLKSMKARAAIAPAAINPDVFD